MAGPLALLVPAVKALAAGGGKAALAGAAKGVGKGLVKDAIKGKAKKFVTGKKKNKKGKGGSLVKSVTGGERQEEIGGDIVATTPMVGSYRVQKPPEKPDVEGKQSEVSFESINNQLDSITGLTEALKKTSQGRLKTAENKKKAERKAAEKAKKRQRESMLERGAGAALGLVGGAVSKALPFDPLKFFIMTFLGSLLLWIMQNGSKIIGFLKVTLALMNNLGKLILKGIGALGKGIAKALKFVIKGFPGIGKSAKAFKAIFKALGSKLTGALGKIGNGLKNMAKGLIKKLKALGKFIMNPAGKKPPKGTPKGLSQAVKPGKSASNAARAIRLKHGAEAAERFQRLVDKGVDPSKASRQVNKAIRAGKIASTPSKTLAGRGGSSVLKGGLGKAGKRGMLKLVGKGGLKTLKRIPVIGPLITLVVSLLSGDPISQALFKTGGAVLGGFLGSFIPIPVVGTLVGELVGEYVGDLMYTLLMGGGPAALGEKMKKDIQGVLKMGSAAVNWAKDGFSRLYAGLPRMNILGFKGLVNFPSLLLNPLQVVPTVYKSFFTRDPMTPGEEKTKGEPEQIEYQPGVTTPSTGPGAAPPEPNYSEEPTVGVRPRASRGSGFAAPLFDIIASGEGTYNSMNQGTRNGRIVGSTHNASDYLNKNLPDMTVQEVMNHQASGKLYAAGKYQIVPETMKDFVARGGVNKSDMFDAATQEKFPRYVIYTKRPTVGKYLDGKAPLNDAIYALSAEFASIGVPEDTPARSLGRIGLYNYPKSFRPKGSTLYGGTGNFAHTGPDKISAALQQIKGGGSQSPAQTTSSATTPQVQPTTPMAAAPVQVQPGAPAQSHPQTPAAPTPMGGALKTGLVTGPSAYIGGSSAFHIDTQIMKSVPMRQKVAMVDQMAAGYDKQGRFMEFSNPGVAGERWDVNMSYDEKVSLLERVFAAHSHSRYRDRNSMDYYIPKKGVNRFDKSAEGAEILAPTVGGTSASFASGGNYGNFVEIKDSKGQVIARTGHGDTRVGRRSGTIDISGPQISTTPGTVATASPTPAAAVSSQLPYERTGATNIMMVSQGGGPGGSMISGGGGAGTPVIMGSGDVVNSYYKAQLLGFLYKQG